MPVSKDTYSCDVWVGNITFCGILIGYMNRLIVGRVSLCRIHNLCDVSVGHNNSIVIQINVGS